MRRGIDRPGRVLVVDDGVELVLALEEVDGVETVCPVDSSPSRVLHLS